MLFILRALVGAARRAVLAQFDLGAAQAIDALIYDDAVSGSQVFHLVADFDDYAAELVPQNLRALFEGDQPPRVVSVVIGVALVDVKIGAAQPDGGRPDQNLARGDLRRGDLAQLHLFGSAKR